MYWLKEIYCMAPKHGNLQQILKDGRKLQRWMVWEDPLEFQEKVELEI